MTDYHQHHPQIDCLGYWTLLLSFTFSHYDNVQFECFFFVCFKIFTIKQHLFIFVLYLITFIISLLFHLYICTKFKFFFSLLYSPQPPTVPTTTLRQNKINNSGEKMKKKHCKNFFYNCCFYTRKKKSPSTRLVLLHPARATLHSTLIFFNLSVDREYFSWTDGNQQAVVQKYSFHSWKATKTKLQLPTPWDGSTVKEPSVA